MRVCMCIWNVPEIVNISSSSLHTYTHTHTHLNVHLEQLCVVFVVVGGRVCCLHVFRFIWSDFGREILVNACLYARISGLLR